MHVYSQVVIHFGGFRVFNNKITTIRKTANVTVDRWPLHCVLCHTENYKGKVTHASYGRLKRMGRGH